ncbi:hypothetical protein [Thermoflexus sp.]|uniref:hypothetical protein n=1 Tax=Thermoflexus sp. TaxID=1969742 RepID=UPI0026219302|nr:hypothetical protein [Thermoflexus sp.]MCX7689784.1 hypothetical protein [Thermoflexus sp.]MDW8184283.1 hypothetical protein [Anaerolineae bacterium]
MPPVPGPDPLGMPIPVGYLFVLKVFGFFLHAVFMNLWLAGLPVAVILARSHPRVSDRLIAAMPFAMAFGINAGIVPLLFLQTLYPQFFYPATILQAWFWFLIIPLLLIAYTAVYAAAFGRWRILSSLVAVILLTWIGFQFSAAMALTARPDRWPALFQNAAPAGGVHGWTLALDPEALLRLGLMAGMAFGTVGAFLALLAELSRDDSRLQEQARPLVPILFTIGLGIFGLAGSLYAPTVADRLPQILQLLAGASMPIAWAAAWLYRAQPRPATAIVLTILQGGVLLSNAIARQVVQAAELGQWVDLGKIPVRGEWGSVFLFLVALLIGIATLAWIFKTVWARVREVRPG